MLKLNKTVCILLALILLLAASVPAYAATKGTVTVKYVDFETGKAIAKNKTMSGTPGKHFSVKVQNIKGYSFVGFSDTAKNDFVYPDDKVTVLVQYSKSVKATIKYLDQQGQKIKDSTTLKGFEGKTYNLEAPYIKGYQVEKIEDPCFGEFGKSNYTIKMYYKGNSTSIAADSSSKTARLVVQSIDQDTGAVLQSIADSQVIVPRNVNFSDYRSGISGYSLRRIMVNGVANSSNSIRVTGNTVISYVYERNHAEQTRYATIYVAAVDLDTGSVISVLKNENVPRGTGYSLSPRNFNGYTYEYTEVNGGTNWSGFVSVDYDTTVIYYYRQFYYTQPTTQPTTQPYSTPTVNYDYNGNPTTGGSTGNSNYDYYGNPVTGLNSSAGGGTNYDFYGNPI